MSGYVFRKFFRVLLLKICGIVGIQSRNASASEKAAEKSGKKISAAASADEGTADVKKGTERG